MHTLSGFTPLHYAVHARKPGVAKVLLDAGAHATAATVIEGVYDLINCPSRTTALHIAALLGEYSGCCTALHSSVDSTLAAATA